MFFPQMMLRVILPAGHYLFWLFETFYAAAFLWKGRQTVSHLTDPDSPLQTKGWNGFECCFRPLGLAFSFPIFLFAPVAQCWGIEESVLDIGLMGLRWTIVSRSRCCLAAQTVSG